MERAAGSAAEDKDVIMIALLLSQLRIIRRELEARRALRQVLSFDEAALRDIGVTRCGAEHAVSKGRNGIRTVPRADAGSPPNTARSTTAGGSHASIDFTAVP
jgi:uncharacterized protein YjiS (DUF1127 family)